MEGGGWDSFAEGGLKDGQELTWPAVPDRGNSVCEGPSQKEELKSSQCGWSMTWNRRQGNTRGRLHASVGPGCIGHGLKFMNFEEQNWIRISFVFQWCCSPGCGGGR